MEEVRSLKEIMKIEGRKEKYRWFYMNEGVKQNLFDGDLEFILS